MPQYKKVFDVGTYAGVSGFTRVGIPTLRTPGAGGKQVAKSLRFRSANTAYLNRTPGSAGDRQKWTWSGWVKRGLISGSSNYTFFAATAASPTDDTNLFGIAFNNDTLYIGGGANNWITTTAVYRDPSAWYHIVLAVDTTSATTTITGGSTDRVRLYVNGVQVSAFSATTAPALNLQTAVNSTVQHDISGVQPFLTRYFDGYLSEVYLIDGQALTPSSFGEYNSDNIWVPKAYSGSYAGTNSCYLDFSDVGTTTAGGANTGYGKDLSGKGTPNNWTTNNFGTTSTATTYDSMYDSPTDYDNSVYGAGNYCVLNPLNSNATTLNNANLSFIGDTGTTYAKGAFGTVGVSSGKWYFESTITTVGNSFVGVAPSTSSGVGNLDIEGVLNAYSYHSLNGYKYLGTGGGVTSSAYGNPFTTNDVIGVALDMDNGAVYFGKQTGGTGSMVWQNSGDPTSGASKTGAAFTGITGSYTPAPCGYSGSAQSLNFGQRPFSATPPTGFKALNTKNITRPTDANMWFYGDTPDLMWIKNRSATADHSLTDTVRGVGLGLSSNQATAEQGAQDVAEMNKFGMTLIGASSRTTAASNSFVYWAWKGGGAATTNTNGSITSTVSANTNAGFSVVTYTGSASGTVGHGLGAPPGLIIAKQIAITNDWVVYHSSLGKDYVLSINSSGVVNNIANYWGTSTPSSSTFGTASSSAYINANGSLVAYCFAPVSGYSAFGSYTGNGNADGPFVYTGFRPRWLMIKVSSAVNSWIIIDTARDPINVAGTYLLADSSAAQGGNANQFDFTANGFKLRAGNAGWNGSGETIIYAAFAEFPFKIARAR